jgi:aromatic-L-amino-acid/L-tryptophan decarboxylase
MTNTPFVTLDPDDWPNARSLARRIIDDAVNHLAGLRNRPVWQPMPPELRDGYRAPVPDGPLPLAEVRRHGAALQAG